MNTFNFTGKIASCKESDKFKPYTNGKLNETSAWSKNSIKFNVICGTNRHLVESQCLYPNDINSASIRTFSKGGENPDGTRTKGEVIDVAYADRNKPDVIANVASFKKFVVDTEVAGRRRSLEFAIGKFKDGTIADSEMDALGVHSIAEAEAALEKSNKKKHEFIWEYDFIEFLNDKLINNPAIKDWIWHISGEYKLEYSEKNNQWYRKFVVQKIYRADDSSEPKSEGTLTIVFNKDAVDDADFAETGKVHINGYLGQYLGKPYKKTCFAPTAFTADGSKDDVAKKLAMGFKKKFTFPDSCDCEWREIGVVTSIIDGVQKAELTEDMLTDEQRENIEFGLITMEDVIKELGRDIYGERVQDIVLTGLMRGYTGGAKDTVYTDSDVLSVSSELDDVVDNIFDEDEI